MILTIRDDKGVLITKLEENYYTRNIIKKLLHGTDGKWKTGASGTKYYYLDEDYVFGVLGLTIYLWKGTSINVTL